MNLIWLNFLMYFHLFSIILCEYFDSSCTEEFCEKQIESGKCIASNAYCRKNPNSTRFLHPDTCNCCEYCLKTLEKGDVCAVGQPGTVSPLEICGPGLQCSSNQAGNNATCERIKSTDCMKAQDNYDERLEGGDVGMTQVRPQCDDDGFFKPYHCIPGSICYCQAPTGERIFGEMPYLDYEDEEKMSCGCSLNAWKAQKTLDPSHRIIVSRCTEIGTFDSLQCMMGENATCLCVDPKTGSPMMDTDIVLEEETKENHPICFDPSKHTPGKYSTNCETEYNFYLMSKPNGNKNTEIKEPFCQPDGKFSRIQSAGSKKICVDPDGKPLDNYEAEIGEPEMKNMDCNCARTRWLLANAGVVELPDCCPNGNFQVWQCRRNECFCVDDNGNQQGMEVNVKELQKLKCYNGGEACLRKY